MAKVRKEYDAEGVKLTMRTRDYLADMSGQLALGIMGNLVGQMTYFYTDKVGMAVGAVGVVMAIAKIIDAFTDVIFGNIIDHSRGGNKKYFRWMIALAIPAAAIVALMFTVPKNVASGVQVAYALVTNLLLTAVIYTMIATPFSAVMVVRTKSNSERSSMGVFRAVGNYGAGMIIAIATIPVTNMLGGTQDAWIKYGVVLALAVLLLFMICWLNGHKAAFTRENADESGGSAVPEEEPVPFGPAMSMLFKNKYWVIVLLFNLITAITNGIVGSAGTYYCKWIFGNDNLVALLGAVQAREGHKGIVIHQHIDPGAGIVLVALPDKGQVIEFPVVCKGAHGGKIAAGGFAEEGNALGVIAIDLRICPQEADRGFAVLNGGGKRRFLGKSVVHRGHRIPVIPKIAVHQLGLPRLRRARDKTAAVNEHVEGRVFHAVGQIEIQIIALRDRSVGDVAIRFPPVPGFDCRVPIVFHGEIVQAQRDGPVTDPAKQQQDHKKAGQRQKDGLLSFHVCSHRNGAVAKQLPFS